MRLDIQFSSNRFTPVSGSKPFWPIVLHKYKNINLVYLGVLVG